MPPTDVVRGGGGWGGQGGFERRIEVFVKIQKIKFGGGGGGGESGWWGIRVNVNEELKFWGKWGGVVGGWVIGGGEGGGGRREGTGLGSGWM